MSGSITGVRREGSGVQAQEDGVNEPLVTRFTVEIDDTTVTVTSCVGGVTEVYRAVSETRRGAEITIGAALAETLRMCGKSWYTGGGR